MSYPRHLIVIPSFNSGSAFAQTVKDVLKYWSDVLVVVDASTDGSDAAVHRMIPDYPGLHVINLSENQGKGGAVLTALRYADEHCYSHIFVIDADGQHPCDLIRPFIQSSQQNPKAMILGVPIFGADAPLERVTCRRIGNWWTRVNTCGGNIRDSLFGFRIYPTAASLQIMESIKTARRFDFDTELVVRLYWAGVPPINLRAPVRYPPKEQGGVTHYRYIRDNLLLASTHARLFVGMLCRMPKLLAYRFKRNNLIIKSPENSSEGENPESRPAFGG